MLFQFRKDNHVDASPELADRVEGVVRQRLDRISSQLTRVEVHVGDPGNSKGDGDKRCSIEIRPEHMPAVAANHEGPTIEAAAAGAADKVLRAFDKQIGKRTDRKGH